MNSNKKKAYLFIKRTFDIVISILVVPFLCVFSLVVKTSYLLTGDSFEILYSQKRVGLNGALFNIYKFRSMTHDEEEKIEEMLTDENKKQEWDKYQKLEDDPRVTKIGKMLRKTSLDELPQFINVLKGDMSLIGPRPLVKGELEAHGGTSKYNTVKPGITGWWACNGRSNIDYQERLELEYYYIDNFSFGLDLLIIFKTIACVIKKTGAQ